MELDTTSTPETATKGLPLNVVVIGAGPSGLLLTHYLLEKGKGRFRVSLYDAREDPRETIKKPPTPRRYSIGISMRGRVALKGVDGLWEAVKARAVEIDHVNMFVLGRMIERPPANRGGQPVMSDRTSLCAAMLELLVQRYGTSGLLSLRFCQQCTSVDLDAHTVTLEAVRRDEYETPPESRGVNRAAAPGESARANGSEPAEDGGTLPGERGMNGLEVPGKDAQGNGSQLGEHGENGAGVPGGSPWGRASQSVCGYDLLVGADGMRSVVRGAFLQHLRSFDYEQRDLGSEWVIANIPPMPAVQSDVMVVIGGKKGGLGGLMLPSALSTDGHTSMCLLLKWNSGAPPLEWFQQKTAADAKRFLERTFPWLQISEEAAAGLRAQRPSKSMSIKCSQYHDPEGLAVLMGDAAHASGPSIGQGVNTALGDAAALAALLLKTRDASELSAVLEKYSALRVLEGHALVDLSESQNPASSATGTLNSLRAIIQGLLRRFFPKWFAGPILAMAAGLKPLTEIYHIHKADVDSVLDANRKHRTALLERKHRQTLQRLEALLPPAAVGPAASRKDLANTSAEKKVV